MPTRYATYTMYTIYVGYLRGEEHRIWEITSDIAAHLGTLERDCIVRLCSHAHSIIAGLNETRPSHRMCMIVG